MYTEINFNFFVNLIIFFVGVVISFVIPGIYIVYKFSPPKFRSFPISLLTGFILWSLISVIFEIIGIKNNFLYYLYLIIITILFIKNKFYNYFFSKNFFLLDKLSLSIIFIGSLLQFFTVGFMGLNINEKVYYCCGHVPDNHLYIAIVNEIINNFPPYEPGIYGAQLLDYHYFSHLYVATFIKVFNLPLVPTIYQFFSPLLSIFLGLSIFIFIKTITDNKKIIWFSLFLAYFGGDLVYLYTFFTSPGNPFRYGAMESGISFLFNLPKAFSIIFFYIGLSWLSIYIKSKKIIALILCILPLSIMISLKAYLGIFVIFASLSLFLFTVFKRKYIVSISLIVIIIINLFIQMLVSSTSGGLFYSGLWRVYDFFSMNGLDSFNLLIQKQIFEEHNNFPRIILINIYMFIIYLIVTFGFRLLSLYQTKKSLNIIPIELNIFLISGNLISFILGMFFLQKIDGGTASTGNFLVNIFWALIPYTAISINHLSQNIPKKIFYFILIIILFLHIPRTAYTLYTVSENLKSSNIALKELRLYDNIRKNTPKNSLVLPLGYAIEYESLWIKYFTDRNIYISGNFRGKSAQTILTSRYKIYNQILSSSDSSVIYNLLKKENIDYLLLKNNSLKTDLSTNDNFEFLYKNSNTNFIKIL